MSQKLSRRGFLGCACCAAVSVDIAGRLPAFAAEAHTNLTPDQALETLRGFRRFWHRGSAYPGGFTGTDRRRSRSLARGSPRPSLSRPLPWFPAGHVDGHLQPGALIH